jgi:hypothetical protein
MVTPTPGPNRDEAAFQAAAASGRPGWAWWMAMALTAVLGPGIAIGISSHNQRQSEQAWCEVVNAFAEANQDPASQPATEFGRRIAAGIARVRTAYHC